MDKETALRVITDFRLALESKGIKIVKLILFGSFASNKFREESDIDLIVISEDFKEKNYWERIDVLSDAIYDVFQPIEATAMTLEEFESGSSMVVEYTKSGEIVFEAA